MQECFEQTMLVNEQYSKAKEADLPVDLNNLCNFGFDPLKRAIEYLAKNQKDQETLITALIESYKQGAEKPFEVISETDPAALEKRIEELERQTSAQQVVNSNGKHAK
jgi:hypothetical protein